MASSFSSLKTKTSILSPAILAQSLSLPAVVKLLNYSYNQSHINGHNSRLLPPDPTTRLQSLTQLSSELEPDGFTLLMFSSQIPQDEDIEGLMTNRANGMTLIATVSAKPYVPTKPEGMGQRAHLLFKRPPPDASKPETNNERGKSDDDDEERWPKWEILANAVHPSLQGRGLASALLEQVTGEIKSRASSSTSPTPPTQHHWNSVNGDGDPETENTRGEAVAKGKVMLMLSTMLEINESYYLKRGFVTTAVRRFEPGTMGSRDGFSVAEMMRWVDL